MVIVGSALLGTFSSGVVTQLTTGAPNILATYVYTVLGLVGAGGIGQVLWEDVRGFYYAETAAVMIIIVIVVSLIDLLSQRLRKAFQ